MEEWINKFLPEAIALRHTLHKIPELKFQEVKTAHLIRKTLKGYGYCVKRLGKTGAVAVLDSKRPGPTVALRADIDGLPIEELTGLPYASTHKGVMHACGHDGHTATLLLVARVLKALENQLQGKVKLLFQPAEEGGKGSLAMIEAGALQDPVVDMIFGYHNWPGLPLGEVGIRKGAILAGSGRVEWVIKHQPAHPGDQKRQNPIALLGQMIQSLQKVEAVGSYTLSLFAVEGSGGGQEVKLTGIYHYVDDDALADLQAAIEQLAPSEVSVQFFPFHPPTVNDNEKAEWLFRLAKEAVWLNDCQMVAEDFSEYLKRVPGCFFLVGAGEKAPSVHTAYFDFQDGILAPAATLMCQLCLSLSDHSKPDIGSI